MKGRALFILFLGLALLLAAGAAQAGKQDQERALNAALAWLEQVDQGDSTASLAGAHTRLSKMFSPRLWEHRMQEQRSDLGRTMSRKLRSVEFSGDLPHKPPQQYYQFVFDTQTAKGGNVEEVVTCLQGKAGCWQVAGYYLQLKP